MSIENEEILQIIMSLIANSGDAKSNIMEAIQESKAGNFEESDLKLEAAEDSLHAAHKIQTNLLTQEASGKPIELSLLLIHSQDHLMNAITFQDLAKEIIDIHKKLDENI